MNQLKLKDIPSDLMAKIDEQFNQHPKIRQMRIKQQMLTAKGMYAQALDVGEGDRGIADEGRLRLHADG